MPYEVNEAKDLVIKAGKELLESGLIARTWGNISARISETQFVITPSGKAYDGLTRDDIVVVNISDCKYEGNVNPSSEKGVHAECYRLRPEVNFVIHTHQTNASALSILGQDIVPDALVSEEDKSFLGYKIPCAKYGLSSTKKLKNAVAEAVQQNPKSPQVLMKYHGAVCMGKDCDEAFKVARTLEKVSGQIYEEYVGEKLATSNYENTREDVYDCIAVHAKTPYIMKMAQLGKSMRPYIDDLAQISGVITKCVPYGANKDEILVGRDKNEAVFIQGDGAMCFGANIEEAEAVAMVLEKGCQAAYLGMKKKVPGVGIAEALLERTIYVKKYSKLK